MVRSPHSSFLLDTDEGRALMSPSRTLLVQKVVLRTPRSSRINMVSSQKRIKPMLAIMPTLSN